MSALISCSKEDDVIIKQDEVDCDCGTLTSTRVEVRTDVMISTYFATYTNNCTKHKIEQKYYSRSDIKSEYCRFNGW